MAILKNNRARIDIIISYGVSPSQGVSDAQRPTIQEALAALLEIVRHAGEESLRQEQQ